MQCHAHPGVRAIPAVAFALLVLLVVSFAPAVTAAAAPTAQPAPPAQQEPAGGPLALAPSLASTLTSSLASTTAPAPAAVAAPRTRIYQVRGGPGRRADTLSSIAERYLGDQARWPEIFALNRGSLRSPDLIHVGATLRLPADAIGLPEAPAARTHVVGKGDTLWRIAGEALGDPGRWPEVFALNRGTIASPDQLQPGWVLDLPPGGGQ